MHQTALVLLLLSTALPLFREADAQEVRALPVRPETGWEAPKKKVTSLEEFFALLPEMEEPRFGKRRVAGAVVSADLDDAGNAEVLFAFVDEDFPQFRPSRDSTLLSLPLRSTGNPFTAGQTWSLFFDADGEIVRLQLETVMTHYRKRRDGRVEVRVRDTGGRVVAFVPTTLMPPEAEFEDGFFSYVDLFREAGILAGTDAVGGPGVLELESIVLPPAEDAAPAGFAPDPTPWTDLRSGGLDRAIPDAQRFAY